MGWLARIRKAVSDVLFRIALRTEPPDGITELVKREAERIIEEREERIQLTVWPMEEIQLRPFSSIIQYSTKTKVHRDLKTGGFVSKQEYAFQLRMWRQETAGEYIRLAHPLWTERELAEAVLRLEELRSKPATTALEDIEIGDIFTPI